MFNFDRADADEFIAAIDFQEDWDDDCDFADYDDEYDGQPDEAQEWHDFDPDC